MNMGVRMEEIVNIAEVEKQFQDEWLLFDVTETDEVDRPVKGKLMCHSKSRDEIHEVLMAYHDQQKHFYIDFAGDPIPPDVVVIL